MKKKKTFREWRRRLDISVEEFAQVVDIPFSTVSKFDVFPDRVPRKVYRKMIARKYPLCPLAK